MNPVFYFCTVLCLVFLLLATLLKEKTAVLAGGFNTILKIQQENYDREKSKDHRNSFLIWGVIMLTGSICFYLFTQYAAALAAVIWLIAFFRDVRPDEEKAFGKCKIK